MKKGDIVGKIKKLGEQLTAEQKATLLEIADECIVMGASSENLGPLYALIYLDWNFEPGEEIMAWAKAQIELSEMRK